MAARSSIQLSLPMLTYSHFSLSLFVVRMLARSHCSTEGLSLWGCSRGEVFIENGEQCKFKVQPRHTCKFCSECYYRQHYKLYLHHIPTPLNVHKCNGYISILLWSWQQCVLEIQPRHIYKFKVLQSKLQGFLAPFRTNARRVQLSDLQTFSDIPVMSITGVCYSVHRRLSAVLFYFSCPRKTMSKNLVY